MTILILDGNENHAVACVRSLKRAGHCVVVGAETSWSKAGWSRACDRSFRYPDPQDSAEPFVAAVAAETARHRDVVVLPMTERTTLPLSRYRGLIQEAGGQLILPPAEVVARVFDKQQMTALAESLGIEVPRTVTVEAGAPPAVEALRFPVVLKPRSSHEYLADGRIRATGAPLYARDPDELARASAAISRRCRAWLVQEYVEGAGVGYFALMHEGALCAEFAHRRLRDVRPTGSGSALRVSVEPDHRVRQAALAILKAAGWHGVAMVEFRLRADGSPVFLEVNGRFWNSLALAVHAGVDFPALLVRLLVTGDGPSVSKYRVGVRCRWFLGDVRHLVEVWRGRPNGFPGQFPGRLATLWNVIRPVPGTYHDNFSLSDPAPELGDWLHFALRTLPRRGRARTAKVWHADGRPSPSQHVL